MKQANVGSETKKDGTVETKTIPSKKNQSLNQTELQSKELRKQLREEEVKLPPTYVKELNKLKGKEADDESPKTSPTAEDQQHPKWTPETRYLRRKVINESNKFLESSTNHPYALRSRPSRTQSLEEGNEPRRVTLQTPESLRDPSTSSSERLQTEVSNPHTHPYNLRSRTRTS